jgi:hypothetical protein
MADTAKAAAAVVCCFLLLGKCSSDPVTGAKAATGVAIAGAGVGAGAVGAGAAGAAAKGAAKGIERRTADRVGRRPNGPSRPYSPTTTLVPQFDNGMEVGP